MTTSPRIETPSAPGLRRSLVEHKRLLIGVVAGFGVLGLGLNAFTPPVYRATVRIEFPHTAEQTPWTGERAPATNFQSENMALYTSAELITNRVLLGRLATDLSRSPSAQLAQANGERRRALGLGWMRVPIARATGATVAPAGMDAEFSPAALAGRVDRLEQTITVQPVADTRLVDIRVEDSDPELAREAADRLANLFVEWQQERTASADAHGLSFVLGEIARVKARIEETSTQLARVGGPRVAWASASASAAATSDKELLRAEAELAAARGTYRDAHPKIQALTAEIAALRGAAGSRSAGRGTRGVRTLVAGPRQAVLENDLAVDEALYARLQSRAREIGLEQEIANPAVTIVEPASVRLDPIRPRPLLNLSVSVLAGILSALGLALVLGASNRTIRSASDAEDLTGLPVLAVIPKRA